MTWDKENNGVILVNSSENEIIPPRPVFYEELDLLGFDSLWKYPKTEEPLLWNIGRKYYYQGEMVAEVKGGGIFETPTIKLADRGEDLVLEPIDMNLLIERNKKALEVLENEAIDFIEDTYKKYKNKVDYFIVSFSGGKDSLVVLDLVSRTLPPDDYFVIFTDTTMEIPPTYEAYEKTKAYYQELYPGLKFYVARNENHSFDLWKKFGPPSRIIRWCCSVYKTSPVVRLVRSINPEKHKIKILVFDGVRSDESTRRSGYQRIAEEVKHITVLNSRVIMNWSFLEVFLYIFYRGLATSKNTADILNKGYRYGLNRVGCSICPFGSDWSEFIISRSFPELTNNYLEIIKDYVYKLGLTDAKKVKEYISKGNWKKRAGGKGVEVKSNIVFLSEVPVLEAVTVVNNCDKNFLEWLKVLGDFICEEEERKYQIKIKDDLFDVYIYKNDRKVKFKISSLEKDNASIFKKALNKMVYCVQCGLCEAECPNGALKVIPDIKLDPALCNHCHNCLNFNLYGCIFAKSINITEGGNNMGNSKGSGIDRYSTFGMREGWVKSLLQKGEEWFEEESLGPKQLSAFIVWMRESEVLENTARVRKISKLGKRLMDIFRENEDFIWQIIWTNLFYNSNIVKWYLKNITWGVKASKKNLKEKLSQDFPDLSEGTLQNPLDALVNLFEYNSPIGDKLRLGIVERKGRETFISKLGTDNIHPIAVAYSLYRYATLKNRYKFTVSEFYREDNKDGGPYLLFGMSRPAFENTLRWLQENKKGLLSTELVADLDNIILSEDIKDYGEILGSL